MDKIIQSRYSLLGLLYLNRRPYHNNPLDLFYLNQRPYHNNPLDLSYLNKRPYHDNPTRLAISSRNSNLLIGHFHLT